MEHNESISEDNDDKMMVVERKYTRVEAESAMNLLKSYISSNNFLSEAHMSLSTLQQSIQKDKFKTSKKEPSISSFFSSIQKPKKNTKKTIKHLY